MSKKLWLDLNPCIDYCNLSDLKAHLSNLSDLTDLKLLSMWNELYFVEREGVLIRNPEDYPAMNLGMNGMYNSSM